MEWSQEVGKYVRFVYDNSDRHTSESDRQNRDGFQVRLMKGGHAKCGYVFDHVELYVLDDETKTVLHPVPKTIPIPFC